MKSKFILIIAALATLFGNMGALAQNLIDGYTRIFYADDLQDGKAYFLISDHTLYSGNKTGKPKGMSNKLDHIMGQALQRYLLCILGRL